MRKTIMRRDKPDKSLLEKIPFPCAQMPVAVSWGRNDARQLGQYNFAWHPEVEFHIVTSGRGRYLIDGRTYPIAQNSLIVIWPGEVHKFVLDEVCERTSVILRPAWLGKHRWLKKGSFPRHMILTPRDMVRIEEITRGIKEDIEIRPPLWEDTVREYLRVFSLLVRRAALRPAPESAVNPLMSQLLQYLEKNLGQPPRLARLAMRFGLSPCHLSRSFSQFAGMGIKQYMIQRRIAEAQKSIARHANLKLSAISEELGFHDYAVFNRTFTRVSKISPSGYRSKMSF